MHLSTLFQVSSFFKSDYVRIFDENLYGKEHLVAQHTGSNVPLEISSLGPQMLIIFDSGWQITSEYKGFKANMHIEEANTNNMTNACNVTNPCNVNEGHCHYDGQCEGTLKCGSSNCPQNSDHATNCCYNYCEQFLDMENEILDFYLPHGLYYRDMQECSWLIHVAHNQVITVNFDENIEVSFFQNF